MTYKKCRTCGQPISKGRSVRCRDCAMTQLSKDRRAQYTDRTHTLRHHLLEALTDRHDETTIDDVCLQQQISHSALARRMNQTGDATLAQLLWRRERYWKTRGGWQGCLNEAARADITAWLTERDPE